MIEKPKSKIVNCQSAQDTDNKRIILCNNQATIGIYGGPKMDLSICSICTLRKPLLSSNPALINQPIVKPTLPYPCKYRADEAIDKTICKTCKGTVYLKVYPCLIFGNCTLSDCKNCPKRTL